MNALLFGDLNSRQLMKWDKNQDLRPSSDISSPFTDIDPELKNFYDKFHKQVIIQIHVFKLLNLHFFKTKTIFKIFFKHFLSNDFA